MTNNDERIKECKHIIARMQEELEKLEEQAKPIIIFGDIVTCENGRRLVLYTKNSDKLSVFNAVGTRVDTVLSCDFYECTGKRIFTDNVLNLDS